MRCTPNADVLLHPIYIDICRSCAAAACTKFFAKMRALSDAILVDISLSLFEFHHQSKK